MVKSGEIEAGRMKFSLLSLSSHSLALAGIFPFISQKKKGICVACQDYFSCTIFCAGPWSSMG